MKQWTPGPWTVKHEFNVMKDNMLIASCGGYSSNITDSEKQYIEKCANAKLISKAPEMVDMLEDVFLKIKTSKINEINLDKIADLLWELL